MDPKLLLVKIVTLLYKESQLNDASTQSSALIKSVIATIKFPETGMDFDRSRESMQALRATALWMCENPADYVYDRATLLQRIRVNVGDDDGLFYAFEQGIENIEDLQLVKRQCLDTRHQLANYLRETKFKEIVKRLYTKAHFSTDGQVNYRELVREVLQEMEQFTTTDSDEKIEGMVEEVDVANLDAMADLMVRAQAETSSEGILRMGWQGLNRMTGEHFGIRRGETVVVGALQHNFKSGFTLNMFKHAALYNVPFMRDPTKKPCLVHISTENDLQLNIIWLYANLVENETGQECDLSQFNVEDPELKAQRIAEATRYVHERLTANGYHIKMVRMDPSNTSYHSLFEYIQKLEADGYEIHMVVCDYLNMISKAGCTQGGPTGADIRELFRRVRNFMSPRGIAFVTPHQLSTEAKGLVRGGVENFVQEIANKGYYDGCRTIDQEVDLELYIHIVKVNGASFLTVQRGKHRKVKITPEKDLYCVLPFSPVGGIRDDILGQDSTRKSPGGGVIGSGDEQPWWEQKAA